LHSQNFQFKSRELSSQNKCIHTKNIILAWDLDQAEKIIKHNKNQKHLETCLLCKSALKKYEMENIEIKMYIPKPLIDLETNETFKREVSELFQVLDLNEKDVLKKKMQEKIKSLDALGIGILSSLSSRKMLSTYAAGFLLFLVLKKFFN
jgi:hypothetical protein